ncbi:phosphate regulon sensor histidine kinase PhoR [Thauera sinica]|uniref:histidine kinase n=1 Tax=Thauera sinica TaxID=2665146 RepID=A0ABW1ASB3_9RHOO|nr:phosphate regulon sensor histidine kinase PhoR [Thauera sp. K11]ATE62152.1 phosphate regulon sensor histidine kinase PhoR [Thauera sp. K11]
MIRSLRYVWVSAVVALTLLMFLSLPVLVAAGVAWGAAVFIVGLIALSAHDRYQLHRLLAWTREPMGTPLPTARGYWGRAFAEFERRSRQSYEVRDRLTHALGRFQSASQAMPDGVLYLSGAGTIEWLNVRAEQHFGLDRAHDLGAPMTHLVRNPEFVRYLQSRHYGEPLVMHAGRGAGLTLQVQVIPFGEDQYLVLSRDISQLERLETMRRDFVANVSHELRTPLTVIDGFLETLSDGLDDFDHDEVHRYLVLAHEQSGRMRRLIDDLLTLSVLETGAPAPVEEGVDVADLMHEVHKETELLSGGRHTVTMKLEGGGVLHGSRKELHSAVANLTSNAVRYTPTGGHVEIGWRRRADGGGEFWVQDDGIGIEAGHIPRLTERFYRVDRGRSRETGGTGLGLAIVKHILTRHQAEMGVQSRPGAGSRFTVRFPPARITQD